MGKIKRITSFGNKNLIKIESFWINNSKREKII
jgi:hypothetical protein